MPSSFRTRHETARSVLIKMVAHIDPNAQIFNVYESYLHGQSQGLLRSKRRKSSIHRHSITKNYGVCTCDELGPALKRLVMVVLSIGVSLLSSVQRASAGGSLLGSGDAASYTFIALRTISYGFCGVMGFLMVEQSARKMKACFKLVTALLALPTERLDRTRRQRVSLAPGIERLPLTNAAAVDAFMSLRRVIAGDIRVCESRGDSGVNMHLQRIYKTHSLRLK